MALIIQTTRPVYRSPTKGRNYLTARSAAVNEASALLERKYPRELPSYENGRCYDPGYHWSNDEALVRVHKRLARVLLRAFRASQKGRTA